MRSRYDSIIVHIFEARYEIGTDTVRFARDDMVQVANVLGIKPPKNLGDLIYTYRSRRSLPPEIRDSAPPETEWTIVSEGIARYAFKLKWVFRAEPDRSITATKIPIATPGLVDKYATSDEQAMLARLRYNRMLDIFTGVMCWHLQSHLRTTVKNIGQVETDDLYVGVDT